MKSKIILAFICCAYIYIVFNKNTWKNGNSLGYDKSGYYVYLPAAFIYNDLEYLSFYPKVNKKYNLTIPNIDYYECYVQNETGRRLNKYPVGIAIAELPFFWLGHLVTLITLEYAADGFSPYYQLSVLAASIVWTLIGLIMLRNLLKRYFEDNVVFGVLLILGFGTNLYYYTAFDGGMSHPFSFSFFAIALNYIDLYYQSSKRSYLFLVALFFGLIIIARPTNILFGILLLLWDIQNFKHLGTRLRLFFNRSSDTIIALIIFVGVLAIQMAYWKYITGHWIHYSYEREGFNFLNSQIWKGLVSYRKGWFVYTPIAFISLFGLILMKRNYPQFFWGSFLYLILNVYVIFSWHQWYYGGGFGCRPLIESLVVLAFPLCLLLKHILTLKKYLKSFCLIFIGLLILLNLWQSYQFSIGIIPWDHNNKTYYWRVFFKINHSKKDWQIIDFNEKD